VIPFVNDRYQRMVARVKCVGVDASVEQVNRCMACVYRRYAKDHDLYVLEQARKQTDGDYGPALLLLHLAVAEK
jgi:endonuclease YncB( thermonuclease family)